MELGICLYKRCRSALDRMSFGLSSARAFRDFVFYPWPIVLGPYGAKRCGCKMTRHFYPWLAVLGPSGAKQCGCKMITFTLSPLSFTFTHVWARWLLAGLRHLWVLLDLTFPHSLFDGCRRILRPVVKSTLVFIVGFWGFRMLFLGQCWFLGHLVGP
jgi:hypothetical protein